MSKPAIPSELTYERRLSLALKRICGVTPPAKLVAQWVAGAVLASLYAAMFWAFALVSMVSWVTVYPVCLGGGWIVGRVHWISGRFREWWKETEWAWDFDECDLGGRE